MWCSGIQYLLVILGVCAERRGTICTDHSQEENRCVYFKHSNSLKYLPAPLLSPCSWCTHYCWKWCSNTERRGVGGWESQSDRQMGRQTERKREKEREREKARSWWYLFSSAAASGSFSLSSLLINRWNITVRFLAAYCCLLCAVDEIASECIMIQKWFVCVKINVWRVCVWDRIMLPPKTHHSIHM